MSLELPALMYKDKGNQQRPGGTYSYLLVSTPEEQAAASANGWHETLPDAIAYANHVAETASPETPDENSPVTRQELEIKAKELGISFHPKISDGKLEEKIDAEIKKLNDS